MLLRSLARSLLNLNRRPREDALARAREQIVIGNVRDAIPLLRKHLERKPHDVGAINDLASCLHDVGQLQEATRLFDLAYAIDDADLPTLVNRGKRLFESGHVDDALPLLRRAKCQQPYYAHTDSVYAGGRFIIGDVPEARRYALNAWLESFDNLRFANCYLFFSAYADIPEAEIASEHAFWAATAAPAPAPAPSPVSEGLLSAAPRKPAGKTRLAYWSPDIRNHSVRYFFRPLLENHDRSRFEVLILSDFPTQDAQTELMKASCDHFIDVNGLADGGLLHLLQSLDIDILVELAGHSSYNRLNLLQHRVARLQLSGIGYPPTTGLGTLDGKFVDPIAAGPFPGRYYTEGPFTLPESFWCFDPREDLPPIEPPPSEAAGIVTFGCVGNISKISDRLLAAWAKILEEAPRSRLLVRCLHFNDPGVVRRFSQRAEASGIDQTRLLIRGPISGIELFGSYREIDIVLDTFPFNGGTTTCFATYMGVPVITLAGESLLSRMGASIMRNMGAGELVVTSFDAYVEAAVRLAGDTGLLKAFRAEARERFTHSHLGNGAKFARAFEAACLQRLQATATPPKPEATAIQPLPEAELVRRAGVCLRWGQRDAAGRIVAHCLANYPDSAGAHILAVQPLVDQRRFGDAADALISKLGRFPAGDQLAVLFNGIRYLLLEERDDEAVHALSRAEKLPLEGALDELQLGLYRARLGQITMSEAEAAAPQPASADSSFVVVIPCDDERRFAQLRSAYAGLRLPTVGSTVKVRRCPEGRRAVAYRESLNAPEADIVVWAQKNVMPCNENLLCEVVEALQRVDAVGVAGARRWDRVDWRSDRAEHTSGSFIGPSFEAPGKFELHVLGNTQTKLVLGRQVLDGLLIAMRRDAFADLSGGLIHEALEGADTLLEEYAAHLAASKGRRLAAHLALGLFIDPSLPLISTYLAEGRWEVARLLDMDPFASGTDHGTSLTVPTSSIESAVSTQRLSFLG